MAPSPIADAASNTSVPTRVRYRVLVLVCLLAMLAYFHRVVFGAAAPVIAADLGLESTSGLSLAFTLFLVSYALFEVPAGWLGDRFGPRSTLLQIVIVWSLCTMLTGAVGLNVGGVVLGGVLALAIVRLLFGAGQAGAFPTITRALHNWFPPTQRAQVQGWVWMSGRIVGGLSPFLWALLVSDAVFGFPLLTWRTAFLLFGLLGVVWCVLFMKYFRDRPAIDPSVNEAERRLIGEREHGGGHHEIPWRAMLTSRTLAILCLMYICTNVGWHFHISYLPGYMNKQFGLADSDLQAALYKGGPLWLGAAGCLLGGFLADRLSKKFGPRKGRSLLGFCALSASAIFWLGAREAPNYHWFFVCASMSAFSSDLALGMAWATCQDIGRRHAAVTGAWMNMLGGLGGAVSVYCAPQLGFHNAFLMYAAAYALGAVCWLAIDPNKPIED
jgi:ACS family glucarate transporter-like MFS transporter